MTTTTETPAAQVTKTKAATIRELLLGDKFRNQIVKALPKHMTPERFARIALTTTLKNPKLLACTQDSLLNCLLELSAIGLEPDGRRAYLIPYKDQCTLLIDYKGIAELLRRNGDVASIHCDVVCENDQFDYRFGTGSRLVHIPAENDRGSVLKVYAFVRLKDGTEEYDVMATEEIEKIRKRSRAADDGPWVTDWNEMAKKTVFRRLSKILPLSPEMRDVIEHDDETLTEQERFAAAKPAHVASSPSMRPEPRGRQRKTTEAAPELSLASEDQDNNAEPPPADPDKAERAERAHHDQMVEDVQTLLSQNGYTEAELLSVLRNVRMITDKHPATSVAGLLSDTLWQILEFPLNTIDRLAELRRANEGK